MGQIDSSDLKARLALEIVNRLRRAGFEAFLVGGCVRDLLLDQAPEDYDVATSAHPEKVMEQFERTLPVGAKFGVVLVLNGDAQVEVATYRTEGRYSDGRRPDSVRFTNAREDALRRDFTMNALFLDPTSNE